LTDASQNTVASYKYDAYGNTLSATGAVATQPYRYSTKEIHHASRMYDYGFRFYSPGLGR
jgi:RHS repeat-associated protein